MCQGEYAAYDTAIWTLVSTSPPPEGDSSARTAWQAWNTFIGQPQNKPRGVQGLDAVFGSRLTVEALPLSVADVGILEPRLTVDPQASPRVVVASPVPLQAP